MLSIRDRETSAVRKETDEDDNHIAMSCVIEDPNIARSLFNYREVNKDGAIYLCQNMIDLLIGTSEVLVEATKRKVNTADFKNDFELLFGAALPEELGSLPEKNDLTDILHCKKWVTNRDQKLLNLFRQKRRLRTDVDTNAAQKSISGLIRSLESGVEDFESKKEEVLKLFEEADTPSLSRAYDIINEPWSSTNPNIERHAAFHAVNFCPRSIGEFVEGYQFVLANAQKLRKDFVKNQGAEHSKKQIKVQSNKAALNKIDSSVESNIASMKETYDQYINFAVDVFAELDTKNNIEDPSEITHAKIHAFAMHLNFQTPSALAYHVLKHRKEGLYEESTNIKENIMHYVISMRNKIKKFYGPT